MTEITLLTAEQIGRLRQAFATQSQACEKLGSALYHALFSRLRSLIGQCAPLDRVLAAFQGDALLDLPGLRLAGGLHYLCLTGATPQLARHYPSCGGTPDWDRLMDDFLAVVDTHSPFLIQFMESPPQTNEVQRGALLLPGLHFIAAQLGGDLELLEIGASAGLNQFLDRLRVNYGDWSLGPPDAELILSADWIGPRLTGTDFTIHARAGCDLNPIDVQTDEGARRLAAYLWPDQTARLARLTQAIALARRSPPEIDRAPAAIWLAEALKVPPKAPVTVIYHSYVWPYLPRSERLGITAAIEQAAKTLPPGRGLAWLRLEDADEDRKHGMMVSLWPGEQDIDLARGSPHGTWLKWLAL